VSSEQAFAEKIAPSRRESLPWPWPITDAIGISCVAVITLLSAWRLIAADGVLIGQDSATQFYPWYSYLGERVRELQLPSWNPAQFSGAPFLADPQSGWTYWPAMVLFTLLPLAIAAPAYILFHLALAGFGAYVLARVLGLAPLGALTAAIAYELSGPVFARSVCCPAQIQVSAWVPILLVGADRAIRHRDRWATSVPWVIVSGVALSQIVASWLGQGTYYALLLVGSFILYRAFTDRNGQSAFWTRLRTTLLVTGGVVLSGLGLAAAGILPRLEYNALSNLAGGVYPDEHDYAAVTGGWQAGQTVFSEMIQEPYYPGGVVIALAIVAVILARGAFSTPYFSALVVGGFILASDQTTPLHSLLYALLPRFEDLHRHWPERMSMVSYIGIAILAGAAVHTLPAWSGRLRKLAVIAAIPVAVALAFVIGLRASGDALPGVVLGGVAVVTGALLLIGSQRAKAAWAFVPVALMVLAALDLIAANAAMLRNGPYGGFHAVDLTAYYDTTRAAEFLQEQEGEERGRYFGYDPSLQQTENGRQVFYRYQFAFEETRQLIVNNRASIYGLQDIQGYNPIQYQRYVEFMNDVNGETQDYHDANIFPGGVESPLLDLLNVRYIIVPNQIPEIRPDLQELVANHPIIYQDSEVLLLKRESALPRAWMVHNVIETSPEEGRRQVAEGVIDPRVTAAVEIEPPAVQPLGPGEVDRIEILSYTPERIEIQVDAARDGLLVVSEIDYPAWAATVDGESLGQVSVFGLLRGIPVEAGQHTIVLEYASDMERAGIALSVGTGLVVIGALAASWISRRRGGDRQATR
jgi:hypothetical protein